MNRTEFILSTKTEFLKFLKAKFPLFHMSNVFFRDLHYGVMLYLTDHGMRTPYSDAEPVTREVTAALQTEGILRPINANTWLLNYADFALPRIQKSA